MAQKKLIDSNAYTKWCYVGGASISNNGKYVAYTIENDPVGSQTLVVQSTENKWKKTFKSTTGNSLLSASGKDYAIFLNRNDSLAIVSLGKDSIQYIPNVVSFSNWRNKESDWLVYQLKQPNKELVIQNLNTGKKCSYRGVVEKIMSDDGQAIVLQTETTVENKISNALHLIDLGTNIRTLIWEGSKKAEAITLDSRHNQVAFISESNMFYYKKSVAKLICLVNSQTANLDSKLRLGGITRFSNDGDRIFIELKEEDKQKPKAGLVEVWSYLDHKIQSQQEIEINARTYAAIVSIKDSKIIRLEQEQEHLVFSSLENVSDTVGIINHESKRRDGFMEVTDKGNFDLIFLKDGRRIKMQYPPMGISPGGKYLIYLDPKQHSYISYNIKTGIYQDISKTFSKAHSYQDFERHGIAGWLANDEGILIYDTYDVWKMDLSGQKAPVNLTLGYGKMNNFVFTILDNQNNLFNKGQRILLNAFNLKSKKNGFYSFEFDRAKAPQLLSIGDYIYYAPDVGEMENAGSAPIKAKKAKVYLVSRMKAKEAPNYFITKDFKSFMALSNVYPERNYNWYTTELHTWTSLSGNRLQGVLYKPSNFDPKKRYPVIFNYYERKSNNLNAYIQPEALCAGCVIDIPTYVSNGYLVFTPDILYKVGDPMQGTYDAVVSAAKYVSNLSFVEPAKMGIQGCSWGGVQTNYLVTHTNLFAAACSASGIADWISAYGRLEGGSGNLNQGLFENTGQLRMGRSIWEIPDAYIKNSPIFQLDKVTTPLLIMHTKKDSRCSFDDAIELFTGLRRLGKKSWMLAYPDEDHGIGDKKKALDFSIRMLQFFDHYLKDRPAPIWMTKGISAERRGLDDGLEYDAKFITPGPGLLTVDEQQKVNSLMTRKPIVIELR